MRTICVAEWWAKALAMVLDEFSAAVVVASPCELCRSASAMPMPSLIYGRATKRAAI
jgi:hypothetical protein